MSKKPNIEGGPGNPGGSGKPRPSITLSGGGAVSVHNGSSTSVHFTFIHSPTSAAVTFTADNLPLGVSAHFSPATLPGDSSSKTVTLELTAASSAPAAQAAITIVASSSNVLPGTLLIHLTVVSPFSEIAGAPTLQINAGGPLQTISIANVLLAPSGQAVTSVNLQFAAAVEGNISFGIGNLPPGVTAQFEPSPLTAPGKAGPVGVQIVLSAGANVAAASVTLTVDVLIVGQLRGTLTFGLQVIVPQSNSNYFLANSCQPLTNVSVTIAITQDLVAAPPTPSQQHGFSFQLNCSSAQNPANPHLIVWQQYIVGVGSGKVRAAINSWTVADFNANGIQSINPAAILATQPEPDMLPAGFAVTIALHNDTQGNVSGATFTTNSGQSETFTLTDLTKSNGQPVTSADLAPIVAFELNIVGPGDLKIANFRSGAGTITYNATGPLQPLAKLPLCVASMATTGETSNSVYGALPTQPNHTFTQSFSIQITQVSVPRLIGLSPTQVLAVLAKANLGPSEQTKTVKSTTVKPAICIAQSPPSGTQVAPGSAINYTIEQFLVGNSGPGKG